MLLKVVLNAFLFGFSYYSEVEIFSVKKMTQAKVIIYIIIVFNSDNDVPVVDNLAPIENITSFGQFGPNYGQFYIFTFIGTLLTPKI